MSIIKKIRNSVTTYENTRIIQWSLTGTKLTVNTIKNDSLMSRD